MEERNLRKVMVYNEMEQTDEGVIIDIVYAIYKENDLEGTQEK